MTTSEKIEFLNELLEEIDGMLGALITEEGWTGDDSRRIATVVAYLQEKIKELHEQR